MAVDESTVKHNFKEQYQYYLPKFVLTWPNKLDLNSGMSKFDHPFSEPDTKYKQDRDKLGLIVIVVTVIEHLIEHL